MKFFTSPKPASRFAGNSRAGSSLLILLLVLTLLGIWESGIVLLAALLPLLWFSRAGDLWAFRKKVVYLSIAPAALAWFLSPDSKDRLDAAVMFMQWFSIWSLVMAVYQFASRMRGAAEEYIWLLGWFSFLPWLLFLEPHPVGYILSAFFIVSNFAFWYQRRYGEPVSWETFTGETVNGKTANEKTAKEFPGSYFAKKPWWKNRSFRNTLLWLILFWGISIAVISIARPQLQNYYRDRWKQGHSSQAQLGFSPTTRLGDMQLFYAPGQADQAALRIWSVQNPGYLRGMVYTRYLYGIWESVDFPEATLPRSQWVDHGLFPWGEPDSSEPKVWVFPEIKLNNYLLPYGVEQVGSLADSISLHPGKVARGVQKVSDRGYAWWIRDSLQLLPGKMQDHNQLPWVGGASRNITYWQNWLELPEVTDSLMDSLIRSTPRLELLMSPPMVELPAAEWTQALKKWFAEDFRYSLNMPRRLGREDPLRNFFRHKKGYCEYFATTATLLLRKRGIPARYVNGYGPPEHLDSNLWVAWEYQAHAWTEYFDTASASWIGAEVTPPGFMPGYESPQGIARQLKIWQMQWQRWFSKLQEGTWRVTLRDLENSLREVLNIQKYEDWLLILVILLLGALLWRRRKTSSFRTDKKYHSWVQQNLGVLQSLAGIRPVWEPFGAWLERAEKEAESRNKAEPETLPPGFEQQLREVKQWYYTVRFRQKNTTRPAKDEILGVNQKS